MVRRRCSVASVWTVERFYWIIEQHSYPFTIRGCKTDFFNWGFLGPLILDLQEESEQVVRLNNWLPRSLIINSGATHGCVLGPALYAVAKNDCISHSSFLMLAPHSLDTSLTAIKRRPKKRDFRPLRPICSQQRCAESPQSKRVYRGGHKW